MLVDTIVPRLRALFNVAVSSVNPHSLIERNVRSFQREGQDFLSVGGREYSLRREFYVVGFGKAVLGMARSLEGVMGQHIRAGVLSVPVGSRSANPGLFAGVHAQSKMAVFEGAKNNLPDGDSELAARKIAELVEGLGSEAVLIVLISGGGSALLPLPVSPVTLEEKLCVIRALSKAGADIGDLNRVRRRLSVVKGGGLARLARPAQVVSLVISDVIGDPLDTIASGPTFPSSDPPLLAWEVLQKYGVDRDAPQNVAECLQATPRDADADDDFGHVHNVVIGSNAIAMSAVHAAAQEVGFTSLVLSDKVQGLAKDLAVTYSCLARTICHLWLKRSSVEEFHSALCGLGEDIALRAPHADLSQAVSSARDAQKVLCLILGGEPTVVVKGNGLGGRSQELALSFACEMDELSRRDVDLQGFDVVLLSGGTDGIDGPTDVAGAVVHRGVVQQARARGLDPTPFLENNDSYGFFSRLNDGEHFIQTGHTGTNVMDIHLLVIAPSNTQSSTLKCHCSNTKAKAF